MYRRHPATRVPSPESAATGAPTTTPPAPAHRVWVVETAKSSTDRDSAAPSIYRRGSTASRNTTVGTGERVEQPAGEALVERCRGAQLVTCTVLARKRTRNRDRLRSRSDRHQRRRAPADARSATTGCWRSSSEGRGRPATVLDARERRAVRPGYLATRPDACRRGGPA